MLFRRAKLKPNIKESVFECRRDDLIIRGTEYKPQGENLPIAIVCHGFMAFQDTVRDYTKFLAAQGYVAYCFDFCGGSVVKGKSDGKTTDMSVLTEVKDLEAVIDYVKSKPYVNKDQLLLMGCSQGGFVCALTAAKLKEKVSKLVLFYPALCIPDDARKGSMMFAKFDPNNIPDRIKCGPMMLGKCYVEDVIEMNPYELINPYLGDVLIVHGTKDSIVHIDYAKKAFQAYEQTKSNRTTLEIIEGGSHGFNKKHDRIAIKSIQSFI